MTRKAMGVWVGVLCVPAASILWGCADPAPVPAASAVDAAIPVPAIEEVSPVSETSPPAGGEHSNRLIHETSPYLLQHAHNPVDWYPWGEEALARSIEEDKPIFLSVGYSTCHWCHVMERESFENEEVAALMNEHFVCIKVDREERPDIDEIYMTAVQAMTGSGGWPMSVFLTPDLKPFFGGTYFPPEDRFGRPGFKSVLTRVAELWKTKRDEIIKSARQVTGIMGQSLAGTPGAPGKLNAGLIEQAVGELKNSFDFNNGGWSSGRSDNKFPSSPSLALLLREYQRTQDQELLDMVILTLDKMADGGIYDHLGGGFSRYSTDPRWLVPHFEKMLYDNAQLVQVYLEAYQVTGHSRYRKVVEESLDYILRDMRDAGGGFYSAEDADSEGEEGKFYLWDHKEIILHLGEEDSALFSAYYNLRPGGNFTSHETYHSGKNILHRVKPAGEIAEGAGLSVAGLENKIAGMRKVLLAVRNGRSLERPPLPGRGEARERQGRVRPGLDDKVLTSWNGLMITAFAQAHQILGEDRYRAAAEEAGAFLLEHMMKNGELLRTHRHGESRLPAYLDDYAFIVPALIDLYETTFEVKWLDAADGLAQTMIRKFWDEKDGGFYFTASDHKNLLVRTRPTYDGAEPSGNSMAAFGLLRLAKLLDQADYYEKAQNILESNQPNMARSPRGYVKMLCAADFFLYPPKEIAIAGPASSEGVQALLKTVRESFVPNKVVAFVDPAAEDAKALGERLPLLAGKALVSGQPAAYVCKDFACKLPVTSPEDFLAQLGA